DSDTSISQGLVLNTDRGIVSITQTRIASISLRCRSGMGAAVYISFSAFARIFNSVFDQCQLAQLDNVKGGIVALQYTIVIDVQKSTFSNNSVVGGSGGALYINSDFESGYKRLSVFDSLFTNCHADGGGALSLSSVDLRVTNTRFLLNSANPRIARCDNSLFGLGGAIYQDGGSTIISNSIFHANFASTAGGGCFMNQPRFFHLDSSELDANESPSASAIALSLGDNRDFIASHPFVITSSNLTHHRGGTAIAFSGDIDLSAQLLVEGSIFTSNSGIGGFQGILSFFPQSSSTSSSYYPSFSYDCQIFSPDNITVHVGNLSAFMMNCTIFDNEELASRVSWNYSSVISAGVVNRFVATPISACGNPQWNASFAADSYFELQFTNLQADRVSKVSSSPSVDILINTSGLWNGTLDYIPSPLLTCARSESNVLVSIDPGCPTATFSTVDGNGLSGMDIPCQAAEGSFYIVPYDFSDNRILSDDPECPSIAASLINSQTFESVPAV
ncbi:MAG: hypothetical protein OJI67_04260, partial [Prosthecobacter sp.]|nr:hypothetical protein [Prosthecobacter sp.]